MIQKVNVDECSTFELFKRLKEGREVSEEDERASRPRFAVNDNNIEVVLEFI